MATTVTSTVKPGGGGDYSSLSAWEAAKGGNLVGADQVQVAECYAGADTTRVVIDGSTTDSTRYLWIKPATGAEAKMPYDTSSAYRLEPASGTDAEMIISDEYTVVERIQVKALKDSGLSPNDGAIFIITLSGGTITVKGCSILGSFGVGNADGSKGLVIADSDPTYHINNNYIVGYNRTSMRAFDSTNGSGATVNLFNNTAVNCVGGYYSGGTGVTAKNCGYYSNGLSGADGFNGSFNAASDYNASDLASDAPGSNSKNSVTPTFVGGGDYHLASGDTAWKDSGVDLSASFTIDFDGATRSGTWDIGADEYTSAGPTTYPITPAGAITPAGTLAKITQRTLAGGVAPSGAIAKQVARTLTGAAAPSGSVLKVTARTVSGAVTPAGAVVKTTARGLAGGVTPAGTIQKSTARTLAGAVTPTGTIARVTQRLLSAVVTPAGAIAKQISRSLSGSITPSGALSTIRTLLLSIAGSIASSGTLVRRTDKGLGGSATPAGAVQRVISRTFTGSVTPTGARRKLVSRLLDGILSLAGSLLAEITTPPVATPTRKYAAEHASALADVMAAGTAVTFARRTRTLAPATGRSTVVSSSVAGYAIADRGDPKTYERLGLVEGQAPTLFFVPTTLGEIPALNAECTWSSRQWTVRWVKPIRIAGYTIGAWVTIAR